MAKKQDEWNEEEWSAEDNAWYQKARQTAEALLDRSPFSYDPGADPLYQTARDQYVRQGRQAMEDTLGRAAALSGGYASSYAQTQGQQAYADRLDRLAALLPDYYDRARSAYDKETVALQDALGTALGLYDKDYQVWLDRQSARERAAAAEAKNDQWEQTFARDRDQWEREFAEDHDRWEAEFAREAEQLAAQQAASAASQAHSDRNTNRSYAYRMAMLALQQGLSVSDELLAAAGIDKAYAETIRRYYYNLHH
jgi:hypothetical protein